MRAAILVESLTGHTWKAGEMIGSRLQQAGWSVSALAPVRRPDYAALQASDLVLVGTWVHGLFVVGQSPWALGELAKLPAMKGKMTAAFCTFALNPGKSVEKMTGALNSLGGETLGGLALHRAKLPQHTDEFVGRLVARVSELV